ncbi:MbnP family copper-binding protein [Aestuariibius insulae]|uniref:MbnP family copper-binding protein n=1 Tax=Aestuariibius insulae TaxID=2058287 RepID=UPI00345E4A31
MRSISLVAGFACSLATPLAAHEFSTGDLVIGHPYSFETTATAISGIGYLSITNEGDTPDRLLSVEAEFERITLHRTEIDDAGVARMLSQEDGMEIAPGETLVLEPGGLHIMFMGLGGDPWEEGESFAATLNFEQAGPVEVVFNIETRDGAMEEMDHSQHEMDGEAAMDVPFSMTFQAMAQGALVDCTSQVAGLGPKGDMTVGINDLRFYVSNLSFRDADGTAYLAVLEETPFQLVHSAGSVALVDLTANTDGTCAPGSVSFGEGTARVNEAVTGSVAVEGITEVSFDIGVPQSVMQAVIAGGTAEDAPSPLAEMYWNWASGYRHFVLNHTVDVADGTYGEGYIHIGSGDCGPAEGKALTDRERCGYLNTAQVVLPVSDPSDLRVMLDLEAVLEGLDFQAPIMNMETREVLGMQPGTSCHSAKMQQDCATIFDAFGIDLNSGESDASRNMVFKVME